MARPDTAPPILTSLTLPTDVNVTGGSASAVFSAVATDVGNGVEDVVIILDHAYVSTANGSAGLFEQAILLDPNSGNMAGFDAATPSGTYNIEEVYVDDKSGNTTEYTADQLQAMGIATSFHVTSNTPSDTTAPMLSSFTIPSTIDVTGGVANVSLSAVATDGSGTGVEEIKFYLDRYIDTSAGPRNYVFLLPDGNGGFAGTTRFEPLTTSGTYNITGAEIFDQAGNVRDYSTSELVAMGIATSFTVDSSTPSDDIPPVLASLSVPTEVDATFNTAGSFSYFQENAVFSVAATDVGTGIDHVTVDFDRPVIGANVDGGLQASLTISSYSGELENGSGTANAVVSSDVPAGVYTVRDVIVVDSAGNSTTYTTSQLASMGFNTNLRVIDRSFEVSHDMNGDGSADIVWRNAEDGHFTIWQGDSNGGFTENSYVNGTVTPDWQIAAVADFNADGMDDLLWRNTNSGNFTIWSSTGTGFAENSYVNGPVGTDWHLAAVGDLNGDGLADLVWRNDNGNFTTWQSTGNGFTDNVYVNNTVSNDWQIAGVVDTNGDGKDDLVWRNTNTGEMTVWTSTGDGFTPNRYVDDSMGPEWQIAAFGNFFGDVVSGAVHDLGENILWRDTVTGAFVVWGAVVGSTTDRDLTGNETIYSNDTVSLDWKIAQIGDFNGDGKDDILWRNTHDGTFTVWAGNGQHGFDENVVVDHSVSTAWTIQADHQLLG